MIEKIIEHFGGQAKLARVLNIDRSAVNQWLKSGTMPPYRAIQIEILTNGQFKAKDIIGEVAQDE
jgi:DNA-binding transcriptional regulator YdaS (Cro superfamily)